MTVLQVFADGLHAFPTDRAPFEERLPNHLLDCLGALIAGAATSEGRELAATGPLTPLGDSRLDGVARAVALIRLTEVDDIHLRSCTTAGAVVIPVVLGLARLVEARPQQAAAAIAAGYEAMIRFAEAVSGPIILYRGLWPTYLAAPIGAAAAASVILGLDSDATARALSIALTQISGAAGAPKGKSPRWLLAGLAARAGCVAAFAAKNGFAGDLTLLDGDWLARTHGLAFDREAILNARVGAAVLELSQKPYCGAKQTIAASEAFRQILAGGIRADDVARVRIFVPAIYAEMISNPPNSRSGRMVNVAYQLTLAAYRERDLWDIERAELNDLRVLAFLDKVQVLADPALDAFYPAAWPATVEVETTDGLRRECRTTAAKGDPTRRLDARDMEQKFSSLAERAEGRERSETLAKAALSALSDPAAFATICAEFTKHSQGKP